MGLAVIAAALAVMDPRALKSVDWGLLVTFAAFFVFSGNMARIQPVRELFGRLLAHGVLPVSALTCQVISNVPAAILLSQFTDRFRELLIGVNIGGAGTLIASLASLITFREYTRRVPGDRPVPGPVYPGQLRLPGNSAGGAEPVGVYSRVGLRYD